MNGISALIKRNPENPLSLFLPFEETVRLEVWKSEVKVPAWSESDENFPLSVVYKPHNPRLFVIATQTIRHPITGLPVAALILTPTMYSQHNNKMSFQALSPTGVLYIN